MKALEIFLKEAGVSDTDDQKDAILAKLKEHSTLIKAFLTREEFAALAREVIG